jgi:hypothetical protein
MVSGMILRHVTVDCAEPYELAKFWRGVTGWAVSDEDEPGDSEVLVEAPSSVPGILFIRVPEGKRDEPRTGVTFPIMTGHGQSCLMFWLARG